jgi:CMP-N,N'-diacetyllegionaminic acid synthase
MNKVKRLALIPARGGSKGIPRKNLQTIAGRSLLQRSIEVAIASNLFHEVCVSTDDLEMASLSKEWGASVPFIRPSELAADDSLSIDVIKHAISFFESKQEFFDSLALLQPTTPFREVNQLIAAHDVFDSTKCATLISVTDASAFHPSTLYRAKSILGKGSFLLENWNNQFLNGSGTLRQEFESQLWRNGSIYIFRPQVIMKSAILLNHPIAAISMDWIRSLNIDTFEDLDLAKIVASSIES